MMRENDISAFVSDDYAALSTPRYSFYWGYEEPVGKLPEEAEDWYFVVREGGKEIFRRPGKEMGISPAGECGDCLLVGIGYWLESRV